MWRHKVSLCVQRDECNRINYTDTVHHTRLRIRSSIKSSSKHASLPASKQAAKSSLNLPIASTTAVLKAANVSKDDRFHNWTRLDKKLMTMALLPTCGCSNWCNARRQASNSASASSHHVHCARITASRFHLQLWLIWGNLRAKCAANYNRTAWSWLIC